MQIIFLNYSFNKIVQKLIRLMILIVNFNILIKLFNKLLKKFVNSKWVIYFNNKSKKLIIKIKIKYKLIKYTSQENL
jgi:hypothetical protein